MFSALHLYAMSDEFRGFENKKVFGLRRSKDKIFINTGRKSIFLSIYSGKPYISIGKVEGNEMLSAILSGLRIKNVHQTDFDRVLEIHLEDEISIYIEITGTSGNIIVVKGQRIEWIFRDIKKRNLYLGEQYNLPIPYQGINPLKDEKAGEKILTGEKIQGLSKKFTGFLREIPSEELSILFRKISQGEIKPTIYIEKMPVGITPYPVPSGYKQKSFSRMSEAINFYYSEIIEYEEKEKEKKKRILEIDKRIKKIDMEAERLSSEKEDYNDYKIMGEAILFNQASVKKGSSEITVRNPYKKEEKLRIEIDPKTDAVKNANKYFKKYKKLKSLSQKKEKLLKKLRDEKEKLIRKKERVEKGEFIEREKIKKKKQRTAKYRMFETKNHFTVLVGKDAKSNEALLKSSHLFDIFFHIRGSPGSFTVLKRQDKNVSVPKSDIEETASIAALFSKQKHSNLVPVSYTEVRYVRKPKKAKAGLVILTKEKVIFVEPKRV